MFVPRADTSYQCSDYVAHHAPNVWKSLDYRPRIPCVFLSFFFIFGFCFFFSFLLVIIETLGILLFNLRQHLTNVLICLSAKTDKLQAKQKKKETKRIRKIFCSKTERAVYVTQTAISINVSSKKTDDFSETNLWILFSYVYRYIHMKKIKVRSKSR